MFSMLFPPYLECLHNVLAASLAIIFRDQNSEVMGEYGWRNLQSDYLKGNSLIESPPTC